MKKNLENEKEMEGRYWTRLCLPTFEMSFIYFTTYGHLTVAQVGVNAELIIMTAGFTCEKSGWGLVHDTNMQT